MKNAKTVLFASLIVTAVLSLYMTDTVMATSDDSSKTDFELLKEAELIEKMETNITYDNNGNLRSAAQNENQERHEELVDELNSRGIFHKSQTIDNSLAEYEVTSTQTSGTNGNPIEVAILSSIENNIETNDSVCCGGTHDKKLAVKAGMEWSNEYFPLWKHRVESGWSAYTNSFASASVETASGHSDLQMYFWTKSDHAVTTASASFTSDVSVKNSNGNWSVIDTNYKTFVNVYYPYLFSLKGYMFDEEYSTPGPTRHAISMNIYAIN